MTLTHRQTSSASSASMAGYLAMFLLIVMFITAWLFVAQAKMLAADCTFGQVHTTETQNMSASLVGKLPEDKHMSHSCVVKTDGVNHHKHFFQVKAKRNKESKGFLHVSAYGTDESHLLGHLDVSKSKGDWSSLTLCPPRYNNGAQDKYLSFSGTPNLAFTIQIDSSPQEIKLNEPIAKNVSSESVRVFQFIPTEDISNTQLDVTVTSESADVPAYLKVSRDCKDVKDNIDDVDYRGESLRLSFAKKGRITLSKVSIPPLTDFNSSWFIGIGIKNLTGNTPSFATKVVTLELSKSFDYSYAGPLAFLVGVSALTGFLISLFAIKLCFKKELASNEDDDDNDNERFYDTTEELVEQGQQPLNNVTETTPLVAAHYPKPYREVFLDWFRRGPKTYSYITAIVGFVLMIGAGQFVFANWYLMQQEGDRDDCYYNDFCYRVSPWDDIPFNLMISNVVYIIHGLILAIFVFHMEIKSLGQYCRRPPKQAFSIGYAFAWALIFEGGFSLVYHLCPSKLTFQFDVAFMFVIAGLTVILLYNSFKMKKRSAVDAANFFLYFLVPLYIFNYFGTIRHSETVLSLLSEILFFGFLFCWWVIITSWTGWKLGVVFSLKYFKENRCQIGWFFLGVVAPVVCFTLWLLSWVDSLPEVFLFACIAESVITNLGTGFCRGLNFECHCLGKCFCRETTFKCSCQGTDICRGIQFTCSCKDTDSSEGIDLKCSSLSFCQVVYVVAMCVVWGLALYYFLGKQTTDKVKTPENSRNLNQECEWFGFFDYHDIWHIFSSHGLLMMVYFVMFMSSQ